jgi:hypothetical protein
MASNTFSINVTDRWLAKATEEIKSAGGSIRGDARSGEFTVAIPVLGVVAGKYVVVATELQITITQKPFLVRHDSIQSYVRQHIAV